MINNNPEEELKMIDIASFNIFLKATWIQKYLDPENHSKWKQLFDSELERNGGEGILKVNLNKKDVNNLVRSFFLGNNMTEEHLLSSPLWQNSPIIIQKKPVFF